MNLWNRFPIIECVGLHTLTLCRLNSVSFINDVNLFPHSILIFMGETLLFLDENPLFAENLWKLRTLFTGCF